MAHQQESFHPFPSHSVSPAFFQTAKRELCITATSCFPASWAAWQRENLSLVVLHCQSHVVLLIMADMPGFKSQYQSSSAAPFPTPPTIDYTCHHSHIFPAFLDCHSKSRHGWPCGMEPIISKLLHRLCNQGELPPSYILGGSHSHSPPTPQSMATAI